MAIFEALNKIDTKWLLGINGSHTLFFDNFFAFFTSKEVWVPFYLVMFFIMYKKYKITGLWMALALILTIVISDQAAGIIKDMVERFRPSHEPELEGMLNLPVGEGGSYGFVSSHAANSFALTVMVSLISKCKRLWPALLAWAVLTGYSRIYLGVHYPFDVIAGAILGSAIGWGMYHVLLYFDEKYFDKKIAFAGSCENHQITPVMLSLIMITVTLAIAAKLVVKYNL